MSTTSPTPAGPTPIDKWSDDFCADLNRQGVHWHYVQHEDDDDTVYLCNEDAGTERDVTFDLAPEAERFAEPAGDVEVVV